MVFYQWRTINQYASAGKVHFVLPWPWLLTFWSQNLMGTSLSITALKCCKFGEIPTNGLWDIVSRRSNFFTTFGLIVTSTLDLLTTESNPFKSVPNCNVMQIWWNSIKQFIRYRANKLQVHDHADHTLRQPKTECLEQPTAGEGIITHFYGLTICANSLSHWMMSQNWQ